MWLSKWKLKRKAPSSLMFILFWPPGRSTYFTHLYSCFLSIVMGSDICTYPMRCNMFHHEDTDLWEGRDRLLGKINWKRFWKRSISPQLSAKTEAEGFWPFEKKSGRLGKDHLGRKDRWQKRKAEDREGNGKRIYGIFFRHVPNGSWKIGNWQKPFLLCGQGCNALWA